MSISKTELISYARRGAISISYLAGALLTAYNITAFKTDKFGLFYNDDNQYWLAVGIALLGLGWVIRNWKKI